MYLTIFSTFKDRCYSVIYLTYYVSPQCSISRYNMLWFQFYFDITLLYRDEIFYLDVTLLHLDDIFYLDITFLYLGEIFLPQDTTVFKGERFNKEAILDIRTIFKPAETCSQSIRGLQILPFLYLYISGKHLSNLPPLPFKIRNLVSVNLLLLITLVGPCRQWRVLTLLII